MVLFDICVLLVPAIRVKAVHLMFVDECNCAIVLRTNCMKDEKTG